VDNVTYQHWWQFHLRACRGEVLTEEERISYEDGLQELHSQEVLTEDLSALRQARAAVLELDAKCEQLHVRRQQMRRQVTRIEAALSQETRRTLGIED
jgi:hypothetical protein